MHLEKGIHLLFHEHMKQMILSIDNGSFGEILTQRRVYAYYVSAHRYESNDRETEGIAERVFRYENGNGQWIWIHAGHFRVFRKS